MKLLKLTNKVVLNKNPISEFKLFVTFDDADDIILPFDTEEEVLKYKEVYEDYMKRLKEDWNSWCNVEVDDIEKVFSDNGIEEVEPYEVWSESHSYEFFAIVKSVKITYFDENGIEWNTAKK